MKAEIVHEVALRAARFCRQIERRSFETQETPDSAQGVEVIYVEIVQQYLATELRLPQNIKQKRKPVKIQVVVTGITGKGYGVPGAGQKSCSDVSTRSRICRNTLRKRANLGNAVSSRERRRQSGASRCRDC